MKLSHFFTVMIIVTSQYEIGMEHSEPLYLKSSLEHEEPTHFPISATVARQSEAMEMIMRRGENEIQIPLSTHYIPILIEMLEKNFNKKDSFNSIDLTSLSPNDVIYLSNNLNDAIQPLLLKSEYVKEKSILQKKLNDQVVNSIIGKNYEVLQYLDATIASEISQKLIKENKLDAYFLKPYGEQLIASKKLLLHSFPTTQQAKKLYCFSSDKKLKIYGLGKNWRNRLRSNQIIVHRDNTVDVILNLEDDFYVRPESFCVDELSTSFAFQMQNISFVFESIDKHKLISNICIFNEKTNNLIKLAPQYTKCGFIGHNELYVSDTLGNLYHIKIDENFTQENQLITPINEKTFSNLSIKGIISCKDYSKILIYTEKDIFIKTATDENFKKLIIKIDKHIFEIETVSISPTGEFVFIELLYHNYQYYRPGAKSLYEGIGTFTENTIEFIELKGMYSAFPRNWKNDGELLISTDYETNEYILANPYSKNYWSVKRNGGLDALSLEGTEDIEIYWGEENSQEYLVPIIDENMDAMLQLLSPKNENKTTQLITVALLNFIKDKHQSNLISNTVALNQASSETYNNESYTSPALKNIINTICTIQTASTSTFHFLTSSLKGLTRDIGQKLYEYRKSIFIGTTSLLGAAALYKYLRQGTQVQTKIIGLISPFIF